MRKSRKNVLLGVGFAALAVGAEAVTPDECSPFVEKGPEGGSPPALTLVWFDPHGMLPRGFETMAREVQGIFGTLHLDVAWVRCGPDSSFLGDSTELSVVMLPRLAHGRPKDRVMGLVVKGSEPIHSIWVFPSSVRQALGLPRLPGAGSGSSEEQSVGRALGRIVAHEVVHAIAPEEPHASEGLMQASLGRSTLLEGTVGLDPRSARALLVGLARRRQGAGTPPEP